MRNTSDYYFKSFSPDEFNFKAGTRTATLVDQVNGKAFFTGGLTAKVASEVDQFIADIKPDPKSSYIHLISLGAMEWYGANKRGDGFNENGGTYSPPAPFSAKEVQVELGGGLKAYHNSTFKANGKVYRNHNSIVANKDAKPLGDVVLAIYNDDMHRGELVIKLDNEEWRDDIDRVSKGKPVYFSMGALCPNDVCSYCGKRTSPKDKKNRCEHLTSELLAMKKDGTQVMAITDTPIFYDISRVKVPADKIAFSIAKVASEAGMAGDPPCPLGVMPASLFDRLNGRNKVDRLGLLIKVASEEKVISEEASIPANLPDKEDDAILRNVADKEVPKVIYLLKKNNTMLPYPHFVRLLGGRGPEIDRAMPLMGNHLPSIFNDILADGDGLSEFLEDGSYEGDEAADSELINRILPLIAKYSLNDGPIQRRVTRIIIIPSTKMASDVVVTPQADLLAFKLAKEYARYQLAFLTGNRDTRKIHLTLAQNHAGVVV